ncbi:MAG: DUF4249 domain-containing protein [Bacteroidota bacterium]
MRTVVLSLLAMMVLACESEIDVNLDESTPTLSVDAFINNMNQEQRIVLYFSQPYFENNMYEPATGASVVVTDITQGIDFTFEEKQDEPGIYRWVPPSEDETFGSVGSSYSLTIDYDNVAYSASSAMSRVPTIDSIRFIESIGPQADDDDYQAEFFAIDFEGEGDSYWIKAYKNGDFLDEPAEINLAFDAGNSSGAAIDGDFFIVPVKLGINPDDSDESYVFGDLVSVEIHSITNDTFDYMTELAIQTDNEGGFAQLFAAPPSNLRTNISSSDNNIRVLGHFSVSAVSGLEQEFTIDVLRIN